MYPAKNWRLALDIGGLFALALAYPLFDVLSKSPEFFVARNSATVHVVSLTGISCFIVPALLFGVARVAARLNTSAGTYVHEAILALLITAMVMAWLNRVDGLAVWTGILLAFAAGLVFAVGYRLTEAVRLFVTALSPAILVVPVLFLLNDNVRDALDPTAEIFATAEFAETPPIIFIVFDELPLNSLLDENYVIDAERYPNFSALAAQSHWFRNTTTVSSETMWAVPALLSGVYPLERGALPTRRHYPNNLFTVLSERYNMMVFGPFRELCPPPSCQRDLAVSEETAMKLAADSAIILGHIVLPEPVTRSLPTIVGAWSDFARARVPREADGDMSGIRRQLALEGEKSRRGEFERFLTTIERDGGARLYFLHSLLPHMAFEFVPSGRRYAGPDYQGREIGGKRLFEATDRGLVDALYQRHLLQVGFVDHLIGQLMARLREQDLYDDALIVVTADHGASYRQGLSRRRLTYDNASDIALVPLFVKLPGQQAGVVSDRNAQTIDVLPTMAEALSFELPFGVDGRSLLGNVGPSRGSKAFVQRSLDSVRVETIGDMASRSRASLQHKILRFGTHSNARLYGIGPSAELLGTDVSVLAVTRPSRVTLASSNFPLFREVRKVVSERELRMYVTGVVDPPQDEPVQLAIALNGVVTATTESYREDGTWRFAAILAEDGLLDGANDVRLFALEPDGGRTVLTSVTPAR
jgi:hypothetical protein